MARGCGNGYAQAYMLPNGQRMSEGSTPYETREAAQEALESIIIKALRVVERVPKVKNRWGNEGERIVLITSDNHGKEEASIIWYDGDKAILWIYAPSLEIALAFEEAGAYAY